MKDFKSHQRKHRTTYIDTHNLNYAAAFTLKSLNLTLNIAVEGSETQKQKEAFSSNFDYDSKEHTPLTNDSYAFFPEMQ
jgi:hypothetical protein